MVKMINHTYAKVRCFPDQINALLASKEGIGYGDGPDAADCSF